MICQKCGVDVAEGREYEHFGKILCEDCYMDTLSPTRTCDPWAVHSAKSCSRLENNSGAQVNKTQEAILKILVETGGIETRALIERLQVSESEFQREFAALRHMELARAEMRDGRKLLRLW